MLNKPRGFVTTVQDPEGRPTVMQFFEKMRERLYPVGRLDYMSEGLLLVTNDGDLANRLTKAGSGVEKVYLVKVAGQPSEQELDLLRGGVSIERGKPGSPQVRTSPARIRQVRQGDNPWYEVVLIEGRNRELRKMFSAVGHFVEKIRRVGYGPLVLDQEPGNMRELDAEELAKLRLAAEGELRTPKAKEVRRRNLADAQLPTLRPKPSPRRPDARPFTPKPFAARPFDKGPGGAGRSGEFRPKRSFTGDKPFSPARASGEESLPSGGRSHGSKPAGGRSFGPRPGGKPFAGKPTGRPFAGKPAGRAFAGKPASGKPAWNRTGGDDRPPFKRPAATRREPVAPPENLEEKRSFKLRIDRIEAEHPDVRSAAKARPSASHPSLSGLDQANLATANRGLNVQDLVSQGPIAPDPINRDSISLDLTGRRRADPDSINLDLKSPGLKKQASTVAARAVPIAPAHDPALIPVLDWPRRNHAGTQDPVPELLPNPA